MFLTLLALSFGSPSDDVEFTFGTDTPFVYGADPVVVNPGPAVPPPPVVIPRPMPLAQYPVVTFTPSPVYLPPVVTLEYRRVCVNGVCSVQLVRVIRER